jgi:hypothetical protein
MRFPVTGEAAKKHFPRTNHDKMRHGPVSPRKTAGAKKRDCRVKAGKTGEIAGKTGKNA